MKRSVKKKTDKFIQFKNSTNGINYRDNNTVISQFNKSVREYKRFIEILNAGDDELAASKLYDAGTDLYMCCEWALKNYLFRRYNDQLVKGEINSQDKNRKVDILGSNRATIKYLLDELEQIGVPSITALGIKCDTILSNARPVNNRPKHERITPDPQLYKISLEEIRKIIIHYISSEASLEVIDDSIYGEEKEWYEIVEDTSDFNSVYTYVLITNRLDNVSVTGLFSLKWDLVIDFDPDSDLNGLAHNYSEVTGIIPKIHILDALNSKRKFTYSGIPYWIMANGTSDNPDSVVDYKKWGAAHGKYLNSLLEEFHHEYSNPVKAFIYPIEDEKTLRKIVDSFNDVYDGGEEIDFRVLSANKEYNLIDDENFIISSMQIEDFADNLAKHFQDTSFSAGVIKKELPSDHGKNILIEDGFYVELSDSFETVYIDIDKEDELDSEKCSRSAFYKGIKEISWYGLKENFDVKSAELKNLEDKINQDFNDRGRLLKKVSYTPGFGGTTLMRRIAWDFREKYPTFILKRFNSQTAKNIQKIYDLTHMPIFILADNNSIELDEAKNLHIELKRMGFAFVICYFQRKLKLIRDDGAGSSYTIINHFEKRETEQMRSKLYELIGEDRKSEFDYKIDTANRADLSPFVMSMFAFDKEFRGIKPYITNFLEKMNDQTKKILFALALADYGNVQMGINYFMNLYNDDSADRFLLDESPGINELVRIEDVSGKKIIRIKYTMFSEEILKQMSNGKDAKEIAFLNLVDNIIWFIEDSRTNVFNYDQDTLNVLRGLFITRKADVNTERPAFSTLISKLQEEHRTVINGNYDSSTDAIVRIFNKLVETYPEEAHFTAHLARFYFYIDMNFEKGFHNIDKAIELSETNNGHVDTLLYHMKAMGYSSRISKVYIKEIIRNIREDPKYDISELKEKIQEDAEEAFKYFKKVRESNIGLAGHVSEINLCIQIAQLAKNILEDTNSFANYIASENGRWAMQYIDRAENLWDECKQQIADSIYEDLDDIEVKLYSLTASLKENIEIWKNYISNSNNSNCAPARRILARAYLKAADSDDNVEAKKNYYSMVVQLMEDNISEDSQHVGNIRIWFDTIKRLEVDNQDQLIQDAIIKLNRWINLTDSVEAHYYRFVLKFIQAIEGSVLAEKDLPKLLRELKQKAGNIFNRTAPRHWLFNTGHGINGLVTNTRNKENAIPEDEMADKLTMLTGRISNNYVNDSHAYISWNGVEVYFNPSATKGEIGKDNIGQRVRFGIGFSYDGPRAYNSSIKLIGKDDIVENRKELQSGLVVKCEVIKNTEYYVQVKIIGFSAFGSIHVDELIKPYAADKRPKIGAILDGKISYKSFDNAKHREVWMISMNIDDIDDIVEETAMERALRLGGFEV